MTFLRMERLCRLASRAGLTLADGPAAPQWTNGLVGISSREPFDARGAHYHVLDSGTTREFAPQRADRSRPAGLLKEFSTSPSEREMTSGDRLLSVF